MITAAICKLAHGQPRNVCVSPGVAAAARTLWPRDPARTQGV